MKRASSVLAARSGLQPKDVALGEIAENAANYSTQSGRTWRSVEDTTFNPALAYRKPHLRGTLSFIGLSLLLVALVMV